MGWEETLCCVGSQSVSHWNYSGMQELKGDLYASVLWLQREQCSSSYKNVFIHFPRKTYNNQSSVSDSDDRYTIHPSDKYVHAYTSSSFHCLFPLHIQHHILN